LVSLSVRVLYRDPRGIKLKLRIDNPDDLWHLYNVIGKGDRVGALSERREETGADKLRQERGEKKKMWLEVEVADVEFARDLGLILFVYSFGQEVGPALPGSVAPARCLISATRLLSIGHDCL
jgi:hypothetical protein